MEANAEAVLKNMREMIGELSQQLAIAKAIIEELQKTTNQ